MQTAEAEHEERMNAGVRATSIKEPIQNARITNRNQTGEKGRETSAPL
jgi:hypothetical protein